MNPFDAISNLAYSNVAVAPSPAGSGTTLTLTTGDGSKFPNPTTDGQYNIVVWPANESPITTNATILRVTARSGDQLTFARQQEGSNNRDILVGDQVALMITKKTLLDIVTALPYQSMTRQAIINGNLDIWQRGISVSLSDVTLQYLADRWGEYVDKNGGVLPTLTRSRQTLTSGDVANAFYFTRLATDGAGTSLGANSLHQLIQKIEHGTRYLCGANQKVTITFWARSSIANKRIAVSLRQSYGSGGTPSAIEEILGTPITLTSSWTKYTLTFNTNTLVGKTFGTNNDDFLQVSFWFMWGATYGNTYISAGVSQETYVGAGNIDIAQVQLCVGELALPFQPRSLQEELRLCQRYCYSINNSAVNTSVGHGFATSTTTADIFVHLPVTMRVLPTLIATASDWQLSDGGAGIDLTNLSIATNQNGLNIVALLATVASGLTQFRPYLMWADLTANRLLILDAEM